MTNSAYLEYQNRWCRPGSSFYYSINYLSKAQQEDVCALQVFYRELFHLVCNYKEFDITLNRLQWWLEEIERIKNDQARHPISIKLYKTLDRNQLSTNNLLQFTNNLAVFFQALAVKSETDFTVLADNSYGKILDLQLQCVDKTNIPPSEFIKNYSSALLSIFLLRQIGFDLKRNFFYLPIEFLDLKQPSIEQVKAFLENKANMDNLVTKIHNYAITSLITLTSDKKVRPPQQTLILAKLAYALMQELNNNTPLLLKSRISLTPFRKFWISWVSHLKYSLKIDQKFN